MKALRALALALVSVCAFAQTYSLAPVPRLQFFDSDGYPLAGGKIYSYAAGTSTPLATYQNSTGTPNTNPIVLDSGGFASIWLGSSAYKLTAQNAAGVQQWSVDQVTGTGPAGALAQLAAANGATLVKYTAPVTGAATRTVADKLGESVSVLDYGAKCDGTTDDTVNIQKAITDLSGHHLMFPSGKTCKISAPLVWTGVKIEWSIDGGAESATILSSATGVPIFQFGTTPGSINYDWQIRNLTFNYTASQDVASHAYAISVGDGAGAGPENGSYFNGIIDRIRVQNAARAISNWGGSVSMWGTEISNVTLSGGAQNVAGAVWSYNTPAIGAVRMTFRNIYASNTNQEPLFISGIPCVGCVFDHIESNNGVNTLIRLGAVQGALRNFHFESVTCNANNTPIIEVSNAQLHIDGINVNTNFAINPGSGNNCFLIASGFLGPADSFIDAENINVNATVTSGNLYIAGMGFTPTSANKARWTLKNVQSNVPFFRATDPLVSYLSHYDGTPTFGTTATTTLADVFNPSSIATSTSGNQPSTNLLFQGSYWTGGTSALDPWTVNVQEGTGTNPSSTLTFARGGSSTGVASVSMPSITANTFYPTYRASSASPILVSDTDDTIFCTANASSPQVRLPYIGGGAHAGHYIKVVKTDASGTPCSVAANASDSGMTINGQSQYNISGQYAAATFVNDGSAWYGFAGFGVSNVTGISAVKNLTGAGGGTCTMTINYGLVTATTCP